MVETSELVQCGWLEVRTGRMIPGRVEFYSPARIEQLGWVPIYKAVEQ